MDDDVDPVERAAHGIVVAHVADDQLRVAIEVGGRLTISVHLRVEIVEHANLISVGEKLAGEMGSDEAGTPGDEHAF
jgi:hypothetical protein